MKLNNKKIFYVGIAFLIICMFWQVYDSVIAKMLINTFGLNQTWSGIVMALDNILAIVLLPVFGALSDKTKTKIGKRKPYIIIGTIAAAIFFVFVSVFDNLQMDKLKKQENIHEVVLVDDLFKSENKDKRSDSLKSLLSNLTEEEINDIYNKHEGDYFFNYEFTSEQMKDLFEIKKIEQSSIEKKLNGEDKLVRKFINLTDTTLTKEDFKQLCDKVLTTQDKEDFKDILSLSHEERTKIENGSRVYKWRLSDLEKVLSERIASHDDFESICESLKIRMFYTSKEEATQARGKLVWVYTKQDMGYLIGFLIVLLIVLTSMSSFRTPAVSLMPDVTIKPLRSKANAIINLMGTVGGIISLILMNFLAKDYQSYVLLFLIVGIIMIVLLVVFCVKVDEPKLVSEMEEETIKYNLNESDMVAFENDEKMPKEVKKSFIFILFSIIFWFMAYNAATTKFSVYAGDVLNMGYSLPLLVANGTALIAFIPIGVIASKIGRKKTIFAGIILLGLAFTLGSIATKDTHFLIYLTMGIAGIGWATINVNSYPMVVEMSKNSNVGKYTGYYYTASMFAQIVTPILSGMIMDLFGTMRVLFPYSVIFCILAFITMMFVHHGDSKPQAVMSIEAFDVDD